MRVSRTDRNTFAVNMKWVDVERLVAALSKHLPRLTITANCSDDLMRQFNDIDELKAYSNPNGARIRELSFAARSQDGSAHCDLIFGDRPRRNVRLSLEADNSIATELNDFISNFLDSVRPWYSRIAVADLLNIFLNIVIFYSIGTLVVVFFYLQARGEKLSWPKEGLPADAWFEVVGKSFLTAFAPLPISGALNVLKSRYFPTATFAFGDGERRDARDEFMRGVVIVGLLVSIVAGVITTVAL